MIWLLAVLGNWLRMTRAVIVLLLAELPGWKMLECLLIAVIDAAAEFERGCVLVCEVAVASQVPIVKNRR